MSRKHFFRGCLLAPPLSGKLAVAGAITAVALPTLIRLALEPRPMGAECVPYCPFVLISAVLMGWRYAVAVALGSALICEATFLSSGHRLLGSDAELFALATFLAYSFLLIGFVEGVRKLVADFPRRAQPDETQSGIIFSLEDGQAWASWTGASAPVQLGPRDEVAEMMEDFLAQVELGKRLTAKCASRR